MSKNPLKSVHITNYYHENSGGVATSYNNLLAAAARHRRFVRLIVPGEAETIEEVNEFAKIYYVPAPRSPVFDRRYRIIMPQQYVFADSVIRRILLAEMPQMIEVTDKYTISPLAAMIRTGKFRRLGRPMLVHFSCERMDDNIASFVAEGKFGKRLAQFVMSNYNLPSFDFHAANSHYTAAEFYEAADGKNRSFGNSITNFCRRFLNAPRVALNERVFVCPRGVDADFFSPVRKSESITREMRSRAGIPENSIVLLYAGRVSPEKNIELLVETMKILATDARHDYRLLIAGAGPKADWLDLETSRLFPGKIRRLGHLDKETLADYYANADIFVHPNPREPFGIAPLEAMASGAPTIAPDAGGILSYATNENAWLAAPTAEHFSRAAREIAEDETARNIKIRNALETARANTREKSTDFLFATYDRMYEDFKSRQELFTDSEKSQTFDYAKLTDSKK